MRKQTLRYLRALFGGRFAKPKFDSSYLELNTIKALLGLVTPALRVVRVDLCGKEAMLYCYFHGELTASQKSDMEIMAKRVEAAFPNDYSTHLIIKQCDAPKALPEQGQLAYCRREIPFPLSKTDDTPSESGSETAP